MNLLRPNQILLALSIPAVIIGLYVIYDGSRKSDLASYTSLNRGTETIEINAGRFELLDAGQRKMAGTAKASDKLLTFIVDESDDHRVPAGTVIECLRSGFYSASFTCSSATASAISPALWSGNQSD